MRMLILLLIYLNAIVACGQVVYKEDFEGVDPFNTIHDFDIGRWDYALTYPSNITYTNCRSARFEIRESQSLVAGGKRSEVTIMKPVPKDAWYSFAVYFPSVGYEYDKYREAINQFFVSDGQSITLRTMEDVLYLHTGPKEDYAKYYKIADIVKDRWHTVEMHIIHANDPSGLIEIWYNNVKVIDHKGDNMETNTLPKWKIGVYKSTFKDEGVSLVRRRIVYFDNIKVEIKKN